MRRFAIEPISRAYLIGMGAVSCVEGIITYSSLFRRFSLARTDPEVLRTNCWPSVLRITELDIRLRY